MLITRLGVSCLLAIPATFLLAFPIGVGAGNPEAGVSVALIVIAVGLPAIAAALYRGSHNRRESLRRGLLVIGIEGALAPAAFFVLAIIFGIRSASDPATVGFSAIAALVIGIFVAIAISAPSLLLYAALRPSRERHMGI